MKSESLEKVILDNLSNGIVILNIKGIILTLNKSAEQILDTNEISEQMFLADIMKEKYVCEEGIPLQEFDIILNNITDEAKVISLYRNIGGRYISIQYKKVYLNGDDNTYVMLELEDVTTHISRKDELIDKIKKYSNLVVELKSKNEVIKKLKNKEKFYKNQLKAIINNVDDAIILIDNKSNVVFSNEKVKDILKILNLKNLVELNDKFIFKNSFGDNVAVNFLVDKYVKKYIGIKNFVISNENSLNKELRYLEINSTPIFDKDIDVIYTIVLIKDITLVKKHEKELEETNNFIQGVVNNLEIPIGVIEYPSLFVKLGNKAFEDLIKASKMGVNHNAVNKCLLGCVNEISMRNIKKTINDCAKEKKAIKNPRYKFINDQGEERIHKVSYMPLLNFQNEVIGVQLYGIDITEEMNHLNELEKINNIKDELYTFTSHELRAPLNIICSSIQLILGIYHSEISENVQNILNKMYQNCSRLLKIINNILDLSKAEAGFLEIRNSNFDIVNITEDIMLASVDYAKSKGVGLIFNTDIEELPVYLDKDKYEKVILNLLSNAIKFTGTEKNIFVTVIGMKDNIIISVKDEGVGIPKDKFQSIFDKFSQVNNGLQKSSEGTGLGLALVKKFVDMMNGEIKLNSEEGKGTEFRIIFNKNLVVSNGKYVEDKSFESVKDKVRLEFSDI